MNKRQRRAAKQLATLVIESHEWSLQIGAYSRPLSIHETVEFQTRQREAYLRANALLWQLKHAA